jgi:hypothetical protein
MKRVLFRNLVTIAALLIYAVGISACSDLQAEVSAAATRSSPAAAATPEEMVTKASSAALPEGFTVISDGEVCGGYLGGRWLTNREAARYLDTPVTLYSYNLLGEGMAVKIRSVSCSEDEHTESWAKDSPSGGGGVYSLDTDDWWDGDASAYTEDPLEYYYLYNLGPESLPDITAVEDTTEAEAVIQGMLDAQFGKDAPEAQVIIAVRADIDADGEMETVVNAANDEENIYEYYCDKNLYCISCIIETDGEVVVIDKYYLDADTALREYEDYLSEYEEDYEEEGGDEEDDDGNGVDVAFYAYIDFFYVQNIIDLDHDGACEFVMVRQSYEFWATYVYDYEAGERTMVLSYEWGV